MKPKFALDLSHEGINLLHRSKGGWTLVGSVALDDPEMGTHLADLRRAAAQLESGGFTSKIIIPNSQILYTTVEAPGPDDIAREVQIRSGLDGLTPYPVGELVFDWRAAGERARIAVLARDTMDEAENFAAEHRFNPVSFVARPPQGEFSGEPFFGKTRVATKILGPSERVEPDASPVPRRPRAMDPGPASGPASGQTSGSAAGPMAEPAPHSPGGLAWQPPAETAADHTPTPAPAPVREPLDAPRRAANPVDDKFAELDAIQAELSGDPDAMPAFRSRAGRSPARPASPGRGADQPAAPPLAPFPPTSDEATTMPSPPASARKTRTFGKAGGQTGQTGTPAPKPEPTPAPETGPDRATPPASGWTPPQTARPAARDGTQSAAPLPEDDTPAAPGVAFSTRRAGDETTTTATPTARGGAPDTARGAPARTAPPSASPTQAPAPAQPAARSGNDGSPSDRRRADMADALKRPLPGSAAKAPDTKTPDTNAPDPKAPDAPGARASLTDTVRGAAGGWRSFGQRRPVRKDDQDPAGSSMAELMRGAGSSEARISPDQQDDEPDLLAPGVAAADVARGETPAGPAPAVETPAPETETDPDPKKPDAKKPDAKKPVPEKSVPAAPQVPAVETAPKPAAKPKPARKPDLPRVAPSTPAAKPEKRKDAASEAEALTVFGARRTPEKTGARKYLGLILTLLLLLTMAIIAMWSSFFVDDGDPVLFNPSENATPAPDAEPAAVPETPDAPVETAPDTPEPEAEAVPQDGQPDDTTSENATTAEPDAAPTPQVLTQEEAEARYAETEIWQRAPETLPEPFAPGLDIGAVGDPGTARGAAADPAATAEPDTPDALTRGAARAAPLPPPPADTIFELDENGLVPPSPEGTVSPTGIIVYEGPPAVVPPVRPDAPPAEVTPEEAAPDGAALGDALEDALEAAVEEAAALGADPPPADLPDTPPLPEPEALPEPDPVVPDATDPGATDATDPDATGPDDARLESAPPVGPADAATETAGADVAAEPDVAAAAVDPATDAATDAAAVDSTAIEATVDAVSVSFVDATELAVTTSIKPTRRPDDIDQIVNAAMARAEAAPAANAAATTTPAIPTSASVATQATTPNALNLNEINLLGISGPTNARRALVRMQNGRYITVKVGDRLDGGRVTSITTEGLTYQKGARNFTLQLLPLG